MHIYKISPIGQETRKLQFLGTPVDAPAAANVADGTLALPCRVARLIYLISNSNNSALYGYNSYDSVYNQNIPIYAKYIGGMVTSRLY